MKLIVEGIKDVPELELPLGTEETLIGREPSCGVCLPSPYISRRHATIAPHGSSWVLRPEGQNGTYVNEKLLRSGEMHRLRAGDVVTMGGFSLTVIDESQPRSMQRDDADVALMREYSHLKAELHDLLLEQIDLRTLALSNVDEEDRRRRFDEAFGVVLGASLQLDDDLQDFIVREALRVNLMDRLVLDEETETLAATRTTGRSRSDDSHERTFQHYLAAIASDIGLADSATFTPNEVRAILDRADGAHRARASQLHPATVKHVVKRQVQRDIEDLVFGLGPLEDLIRTPGINEVMVVSNDHIYIEKDGAVEETGRAFPDEADVEVAVSRILAPAGRTVNRSQPIVDARLEDGSRVHVVVPPIALRGAAITIRKFRKDPFTLDDLVALGSVNDRAVSLLRACVRGRKNIVISGGTGSGKTTLLNTLSSQIPPGERIVVIEDSAELQLQQPHVVQLEARKANTEGTGAVPIRELVRASLRMRPDRIVVGECRGGEALDMLQAMNTGHDGSMTTAHANTPRDMMQRLEVMVLEAGQGMPVAAIQRQIATAVDVVIQIRRMRDKKRRVTAVAEVVGYDPEDGILMEDILTLRQTAAGPELHFTGYLPTFIEPLLDAGDTSLEELF